MSKILVLGRTMDMGGTEVAMAALLQKLVEKKEDVTLLLVEKRGVLLERIPKEVEVRHNLGLILLGHTQRWSNRIFDTLPIYILIVVPGLSGTDNYILPYPLKLRCS